MDYGRRVFTASGEMQAQQVRGFLDAAGITSELRGEALRNTHGLTLNGLGMVEILVSADDEPRARALLASAEGGEFRLDDDAEVRSSRRVTTSPTPDPGAATRNLVSISPFFIVKDLQASIRYYVERLGFQLDFQGPEGDPYYAGVKRDGVGIMLKAIRPDVLPSPNHSRHEWARWDAYIYTLDPDILFDEFRQQGVKFVKELSFIDEGLWGFEIADADGYVLAFFRLRKE